MNILTSNYSDQSSFPTANNCDLPMANNATRMPLRYHVQQAVEQYFLELEGEEAKNLYQTILQEVEKPLLEVALKHTQGNQSKTAQILGLNRGTLRKKMQQYDLM